MSGTEVRKVGPNLNVPGNLGDNTVIDVMR
jgi:hypothetical protein